MIVVRATLKIANVIKIVPIKTATQGRVRNVHSALGHPLPVANQCSCKYCPNLGGGGDGYDIRGSPFDRDCSQWVGFHTGANH